MPARCIEAAESANNDVMLECRRDGEDCQVQAILQNHDDAENEADQRRVIQSELEWRVREWDPFEPPQPGLPESS